MTARHTRRTTMAAAVCTVVALMAVNPAAEDIVSPVVEGLDGPRGVAVGSAGRVLFTQGDGSYGEVVTKGNNAGAVTMLGGVPAAYIAPRSATRWPPTPARAGVMPTDSPR